MKEFLFLYRIDNSGMQNATPEQAQASLKQWMDWLNGIGAKNKLTTPGHKLQSSGKVVKGNDVVTNGPYTDIKESIGGYSIIKADSYDEAVEVAKGCPALQVGGNVEVRELDVM